MGKAGGARKNAAVFLGVAISAIILGVLLYSVEWAVFWKTLGQADSAYIPLLVALIFFSFWIRALRWRYLLPSGTDFSTFRLFEAIIIGFFATCILPLRAGEFVRPLVLSRWQPVSFSLAFATVVTERVFDVLALMALLGLWLSQIDQAPALVVVGARALGVLALCILLVMIFSYFKSQAMLKLVRWILDRLGIANAKPQLSERLVVLIEEFLNGLRAISSYRELGLVIFWSLFLWFEMALMYQVGMWIFGEFPPFWVGVAITAMIALAVAAPSAPGFLGTFQAGCVVALSWIYGYSEAFAVAYSVLLHAFQIFFLVILGLLILRFEGLVFRDLRSSVPDEAEVP